MELDVEGLRGWFQGFFNLPEDPRGIKPQTLDLHQRRWSQFIPGPRAKRIVQLCQVTSGKILQTSLETLGPLKWNVPGKKVSHVCG